ncbi:MAG: hypothetical protein COB01_01080 [Lutibacter sp.]|nr:MAG: hypothetical protein COB01_01080 [Lutibacter sp.]
MKTRILAICLVVFSIFKGIAQEETEYKVFENQPLNFKGEEGNDNDVTRFQNGRIIYRFTTIN